MLPAWLDPLFESDEMRAVDEFATTRGGVASLDLMERAGTALARSVLERARSGPIRVVIGKGNNGGDGLVAARVLRAGGREVDVLAVMSLEGLSGDPRDNLERLPGAAPARFDVEALDGSAVVVDAILGTGSSGAPGGPMAGAIEAINATDAPVIACDVPSGVNASTGEVEASAVRAQATVTFHGSKVGLHVAPGSLHAGEVHVAPIGIPREAPTGKRAGLIDARIVQHVPRRERDGTKFSSGSVVIAGGSRGLTGAPTMVALSAQRTGAGYVQVAVPAAAERALELRLLEAMTRGMPERDGMHTEEGAAEVVALAERAGAVVLGPGIGRGDGAVAFARALAQSLERPLVVDADGLNAHAGVLESLAARSAPTVLTPHEGELGRLLEADSDSIAAHRLTHAREAARRSGAIVVLKGDDSIVASPEGPVAISRGGSPGLATAGTGDVLSGVIGAILSKGLDPFTAACAAVLVHASAGRVAAARYGSDHTVAGDVIDALPATFADLRSGL